MQYKPAIISPPILVSDRKEIPIGGLGDTLNVSLDTVYDTEIHLQSKESIPLTPKPSVSLYMKHKDVVDVITRGESFDITVKLSQPLTQDMDVDFSITESVIPDWNGMRKMNEISVNDNFDYNTLIQVMPTSDLDVVNGTITILAGQTENTVTITSTANTDLFYGKGSYFCSKVTISNVSSTADVMLNHHREAYVLYEDSMSYPKWNNFEVELWGKLPNLSYYQPIEDPESGQTVTWTFDYDVGTDELGDPILTDTTLRTKIIDDIPIESIQLRPVDSNVIPVDIENVAPIDLSTKLPMYKCVIVAGRRD